MKRSLLAIVLCTAASASANLSLEEAKARVERAQAEHTQAVKRYEDLKKQVATKQEQITKVAGQVEYAESMEQAKKENGDLIDQQNQAVQECQEKLADLQRTVSEVGKEHQISTNGEKYTVVKTERSELQPIIQMPAPKRTQYSVGGSYPRATR